MINQKTPVENYQKVIKDAELLYTDTEINKTIDDISKAIKKYQNSVSSGNFPDKDHCISIDKEILKKL